MGRKSKKKGIYVYIWLVHFTVQQELAQHCNAAIPQLSINQSNTKKKKRIESQDYFIPESMLFPQGDTKLR